MLFNSIQFLLFFPLVTLLFYFLPQRFRWVLLLAASCLFYMAFIPVYIFILAITILIDYFAGQWIEDSAGPRRTVWLVISILSTCTVLFIFKYFNFFNTTFAFLFGQMGLAYPVQNLSLILPIGLSFHTFQSLSYVIEVYRRNQKAERRFGIYSLYVMFYPQLVAGPIERPQNLLRQFDERHVFDARRVSDGLRLMLWGMFQKVVVADNLAPIVNGLYNHPRDQYEGLIFVVATIFFAVQIYCDFAGYSHIAIGAARVMGFRLMKNFDMPYFASSISEFWKRWHISLSTWFRDYLYIPLGGNRVAVPRWYFNLFIVFVVSGLWHGANWTFVIWGALHGLFLIAAIVFAPLKQGMESALRVSPSGWPRRLVRVAGTFLLVNFAWIFFRANSLPDALYIVSHLFCGWGLLADPSGVRDLLVRKGITLGPFLLIALLLAGEALWRRFPAREWMDRQSGAVRWTLYYAMGLAILLLGNFSAQQFIYFQF